MLENHLKIMLENHLINLVLLIIFSLGIRTTLLIIGQRWVSSFAQTSTIVILPIITYVITNVISGNIALSLGMVGALSIVRFRNPVKSPLELSVYFATISMGVAASVSTNWLLFLFGSLVIAFLILLILNYLSKKIFSKPFFLSTFSDGETQSSLTIVSKENIDELQNSNFLSSSAKSENKFVYILSSNNFEELNILAKKYKEDLNVLEFNLIK